MARSRRTLLPLIRQALKEDRAVRDATSRAVLGAGTRIRAEVLAKESGIVAGAESAARAFTAFDRRLRCRILRRTGARVAAGVRILVVQGRARSVFAAERTALNLLGHLSGVATLTRRYVLRVRGTRARIYDTRKTLPGLRALQKEAVRAGGGHSHRADLSQAIVIKTNHVLALSVQRVAYRQALKRAIQQARRRRPRRLLEVEVRNLAEFKEALALRPGAILLDNWTVGNVRRAVSFLNATRYPPSARPLLEVSGGVTLANVRAIARTGVERISIGRLTHSAPALDVSLRVIRKP